MKEKITLNEIPSRGYFNIFVLRALYNLDGEAKKKDIREAVLNFFEIEDHLWEQLTTSNRPIIMRRIGFIKLQSAGLIDRSARGVWKLTDQAKQDYPKDELENYDDSQIEKFNEDLKQKNSDQDTPENQEAEKDEDEDENEFLDYDLKLLREIDWRAFEKLCKELFEAVGYEGVRNTQATADGGYDGVGYWQTGLTKLKVIFESKRYDEGNSISPKKIRAFCSVINQQKADKGVFITTSNFTGQSIKEAYQEKNIELIDGKKLLSLLYKYNVRCVNQRIDEEALNELNNDEE